MFVIAVYVTSRYRNYPEFKAIMDEAVKKYLPVGKPSAFCTGSSKGNDAGNGMVRRYAFEMNIPCRVFETRWSEHIPQSSGKKNTAGVRSNAMIVRSSNAAIMLWTPTSIAKWDYMSGGCYSFRKMCAKMRRELIPVKVDIYKPIEKVQSTAAGEDEPMVGDMGVGMRAMDMGGEMPPTASASLGSADSMPSMGGGAPSVAAAPTAAGASMLNVPMDVDADGTPDVAVSTIDTNGDGIADSQFAPIDTDGDGAPDSVGVSPLEPISQTTLPAPPMASDSLPSAAASPSTPPSVATNTAAAALQPPETVGDDTAEENQQ